MEVGWRWMKMEHLIKAAKGPGIKGGSSEVWRINASQRLAARCVWFPPAFFRVCLCRKHATTSSWNFQCHVASFLQGLKYTSHLRLSMYSSGYSNSIHEGICQFQAFQPSAKAGFPTCELGSFKTASWKAVYPLESCTVGSAPQSCGSAMGWFHGVKSQPNLSTFRTIPKLSLAKFPREGWWCPHSSVGPPSGEDMCI